jgi:DNA-binding response OmpR family regulator
VLRRSEQPEAAPEIITVSDLQIDLSRHTVTVAGKPVELTTSEFELLAALARYPGRAFTRAQLLEQTQSATYEGYERTIDQHIKNLRHKLEPDPRQPRYVLTVHGVGYKLVEA